MLLVLLVLAQPRPLQVVPQGLAAAALEPQLAAAPDGAVYLAFGAGDQIYVCKSTDDGRTFSAPLALSADDRAAEKGSSAAPKTPLGMRRGPRIAASKSRVVVTAVFGAQGGGKDGDLLAWRSSDGAKWDGPSKVSDVPGAAREGLHAMGVAADGTFVAVWLDLRQKGTTVMGSFSSNGGRSWSQNKLVYESPDGSVCQCCHPSLAFGSFGEVGAMFRNSFRGDRDMYVAISPDGGRSWGPSSKIGTQTWTIDACPMDGGAVTFDTSGEPLSVFRSRETVYMGRGPVATEVARGVNPWIAMTKNGPVLVWQSSRDGAVYVQNGNNPSTRKRLTESGSDPVVIATKSGAIVAWRESGAVPGIYVFRM